MAFGRGSFETCPRTTNKDPKVCQVEMFLQEVEYIKAQMRLMNAKRYGSSSEKANENQLRLFDGFNEAEATVEPFAPGPEVDLITVPEHKELRKKVRETPALTVCGKTSSNIISQKTNWLVLVLVTKGMSSIKRSQGGCTMCPQMFL